MEQFKEVNVIIPAGSDTARVGVRPRGIVPASVASSSDDGRSAMFTAGVAPEMATVASILEDEKEKEQSPVMEAQIATGIEISTHCRSISANTVILDCLTLISDKLVTTAPALESQSWVSIIEEEQAASAVPVPSMKIDVGDGGSLAGRTAAKRKAVETDSLDDSASDAARGAPVRPRASRKKVSVVTQSQVKPDNMEDNEIPICSNQESASSGTDVDERRGKVGRPRRKTRAIDPLIAEQEILRKTDRAPENIEDELLRCMTASDISAQALEYLAAIDTIRTKCGRMQGGLSGELRRRTRGLENLVRALQLRAEAAGDPQAQKEKIEELLNEVKENRREKEQRKREISELQDLIKELKKENKGIREEMRRSFKEEKVSKCAGQYTQCT